MQALQVAVRTMRDILEVRDATVLKRRFGFPLFRT